MFCIACFALTVEISVAHWMFIFYVLHLRLFYAIKDLLTLLINYSTLWTAESSTMLRFYRLLESVCWRMRIAAFWLAAEMSGVALVQRTKETHWCCLNSTHRERESRPALRLAANNT